MLLIDPAQAKAFVAPLGQMKFDRSIGEMLMNADVAVSMPEMGSMFKDQVKVITVHDTPLMLILFFSNLSFYHIMSHLFSTLFKSLTSN